MEQSEMIVKSEVKDDGSGHRLVYRIIGTLNDDFVDFKRQEFQKGESVWVCTGLGKTMLVDKNKITRIGCIPYEKLDDLHIEGWEISNSRYDSMYKMSYEEAWPEWITRTKQEAERLLDWMIENKLTPRGYYGWLE